MQVSLNTQSLWILPSGEFSVLDFYIPLGTESGFHLLALPCYPFFEKQRSWGTEQWPEEPPRA